MCNTNNHTEKEVVVMLNEKSIDYKVYGRMNRGYEEFMNTYERDGCMVNMEN